MVFARLVGAGGMTSFDSWSAGRVRLCAGARVAAAAGICTLMAGESADGGELLLFFFIPGDAGGPNSHSIGTQFAIHPGSVLDKRTEFRFPPNHPFGGKVGLCQVLGKCWVALP